jgi:predicted aspartyl protease
MQPKRLSLVIFLLALSPTPLAVGRPAEKAAAALSSLLANYDFRRVNVDRADSDLALRVSINGKAAALVIATAAPMTVLDRNSIGRFGLREQKTEIPLNSTLGKTSEQVGLSKVKGLELANIVLADFEAGVIDESVLNRTLPRSPFHLAGVFGYSQMRKLGAVLDCGQRNLYVNPRGVSRAASATLEKFLVGRGFVSVPMRLNRYGHPEVDCHVNGRASKATIETAAFTTIIDQRLAAKAGISLTRTNAYGEGVGERKAPLSSGVAREFSIGTFQTNGEKLSAATVWYNVLGVDYLVANDAIIDSGSMNLFLRHQRSDRR